MEPSRVEIVLVRPSRAHNVAAACRAMKNMGLRTLWLVEPRPGLEEPSARALAYGAWDVLDGARRAASLSEAVSHSGSVVGTSALDVPGTWSPRRLAAEGPALAGERALSLVFGPESTGLSAAERALCHRLVRIPSDPEQPSLNLAQAVLLLAYELRLGLLAGSAPTRRRGRRGARERRRSRAGDRRAARRSARDRLPGPRRTRTTSSPELRGLLTRARPTPREVLLLRGLAKQAAWAGRIARGRGSAG